MAKVKKKKKTGKRELSPAGLRRKEQVRWVDAARYLPVVRHVNRSIVPAPLYEDFVSAYRRAVLQKHWISPALRRCFRNGTYEPGDVGEFGSLIVSQMTREVVAKYAPPFGLRFSVSFRFEAVFEWFKMTERVSPAGVDYGNVLYHPDRPRIPINGGSYIPAFSKHAVSRFTERQQYETAAGLLSCSSLLAIPNPKLDVSTTTNEGYWMWAVVRNNSPQHWLLKLLFGRDIDPAMNMVRVGYFPVVYAGSFAVAKTMLSPAMKVKGVDVELCQYGDSPNDKRAYFYEMAKLHRQLPLFKPITHRQY